MTPQTTSPLATAQERRPGGEPGKGRADGRSSGRGWFLVGLLVVGVVVLLAVLTPGGTDEPLDPDSAGPSGSRAVAELLRQHGVEVTKVTHSAEALRLTSGTSPSTLVLVRTHLLGPDQLDRLLQSTARLVVVEPSAPVLEGLELWVEPRGSAPKQVRAPGCTAPGPVAAGEALAGGRLYRLVTGGTARPPEACYPSAAGDAWSYVEGDLGDFRGTVIGQGQILANEHLAEEGNAALALHALGRDPRVVWYVPDPFEAGLATSGRSLTELAPDWVPWVLRQLAIAAVIAILWRGRRFGPLVTEPLPVVVRSSETLEGRAALYRQAHARDRAAATLRTATLRRLARRLDLARDTAPEVAAELIAQAAGRPPSEISTLLLGPAPAGDAALVTLSRDLDDLEAALRTKG